MNLRQVWFLTSKRGAGDDAVGQNDLGGPGRVVLWTIEPFFLS